MNEPSQSHVHGLIRLSNGYPHTAQTTCEASKLALVFDLPIKCHCRASKCRYFERLLKNDDNNNDSGFDLPAP